MHDPRALLDMGADAVRRLARRGYTLDLSRLEDLMSRRSKSIQKADELRSESKRVAQKVQTVARQGGDVEGFKERARHIKDEIRDVESERDQLDAELRPCRGIRTCARNGTDGDSEEFAAEVRREAAHCVLFRTENCRLGVSLGISTSASDKLSGRGSRSARSRRPAGAGDRGILPRLHTPGRLNEYSVP